MGGLHSKESTHSNPMEKIPISSHTKAITMETKVVSILFIGGILALISSTKPPRNTGIDIAKKGKKRPSIEDNHNPKNNPKNTGIPPIRGVGSI